MTPEKERLILAAEQMLYMTLEYTGWKSEAERTESLELVLNRIDFVRGCSW